MFKIIKIKEEFKDYELKFLDYEYNENDELRKTEIDSTRKKNIEKSNKFKETINVIINKCKHLVSSFHHSESLTRKLKEKQDREK